MLVLSRKVNESIVINDNITVTIVDIRTDKVRLGIVHPKEVSVHRQEVFDLIAQNPKTPAIAPPSARPQHRVESPPNPFRSMSGFEVTHTLKFARSAINARRVIDFTAGLGKTISNSEVIEIVFTPDEWAVLLAHFETW